MIWPFMLTKTIAANNLCNMYVEVSVTVNYLLSHLYTKLPRRRVDNFGEELERCLIKKLQPHWFIEGNATEVPQRCLHTYGPQADFLFSEAAISSGLAWSEIQACLPVGLVISIDPGYVACQYGSITANENTLTSSNQGWISNPYNSTSLSSSGCSSASSVSSNASSCSWPKTKQQVLYSASSRNDDQSTSNQQLEKDVEHPLIELKKHLEDSETHLATEAALSVLTESDEITNALNPQGICSNFSTGLFESKINNCVADTNQTSLNTVPSINPKQTRIFASAIGDIGNNILPDQSRKSYSSTVISNCNEECNPSISKVPINSFVVADATGDRNFFETFPLDSCTKSDIECNFTYSVPSKLTQHLINPAGLVDVIGETDFQQTDYLDDSQQNFISTSNFIQKSTSTPSFTAATFAQTKFGSTKLKSLTKRPHRLVSPSEVSNTSYPNQVLENVSQAQTSNNQMHDRFLNELRRGSTNKGYFCNQNERSSDITNGYVNTVENNFINRSGNIISNPIWSQFEKIRNEFQLKNNQQPDLTSSENTFPNMRLNVSQMPGVYSSNFSEKIPFPKSMNFANKRDNKNMFSDGLQVGNNSNLYSGFKADVDRGGSDFFKNFSSVSSKMPAQDTNMMEPLPDSWFAYPDESLNIDLHDLWNSHKMNFCWPRDKPSPVLDNSLGQIFNGLNIADH